MKKSNLYDDPIEKKSNYSKNTVKKSNFYDDTIEKKSNYSKFLYPTSLLKVYAAMHTYLNSNAQQCSLIIMWPMLR